jgi:hypothetical protein
MRDLLAAITEDVATRSIDAWHPGFGKSPARNEAEAVAIRTRSDGVTPWDQAPMEVVWKASELLYVATLGYTRATAALMVPPFRSWEPTTEARSALEAAAQAAWLFDPKVANGLTRVGRYYTLRHYMAGRLEYTYDKVKPDDSLGVYGKNAVEVEAEAAMLGLTPVLNKHNQVIGYEGQQMESLQALVEQVVGDNGAYSVFSGSAHSEFWSLLSGYQGKPPSPLGVSADEHEGDHESFVPLVRACLQALFKPIDYACYMFDRGALANDLARLYREAEQIIGELPPS